MSTPKDLRERFATKSSSKADTTKPEMRVNVSELLGLTNQDMHNVVVADIEGMINKGFRTALDGYVLCLSRIIKHDKAWKSIVQAFHNKNEKVPQKYYTLFGQTSEEIKQKGISAT